MAEHRHRAAPRLSLSPWFRSRRVLASAAGLLLVVGLATAGYLAPKALLERFGLGGVVAEVSEAKPPTLRIGPLSADAPTPSSTGLAAKLDRLASVPELGTLSGVVLDPATERVLWSRAPNKAQVPGSTAKLLTAAAALLALDPTSRLTTRVVAGSSPDSVVLVGGGDPTLSALPAGKESVYPGAARLDTLVEAVRAAHPGPIRSVTVDLSRYRGPVLASGWLPEDVPGGYVTPIEPLTLDGGRSKPAEIDPPRTTTPGVDAGKEFAKRLGADPGGVREQTASSGAQVLGEVHSPPIADLVQTALRISDNVLAEALARQVAITKGAEPSFSGSAREVLATLTGAGLDTGATTMKDGSGLSTADEISAKLLGEVMVAAAAPSSAGTNLFKDGVSSGQIDKAQIDKAERTARLRALLGGLPVAGGDGTLDARFVTGPSESGRGYVRAKTGTLTGVSSLAGTVTDTDGRLLVFAWLSNGTSPAESRPRLDALAAVLRGCGCG